MSVDWDRELLSAVLAAVSAVAWLFAIALLSDSGWPGVLQVVQIALYGYFALGPPLVTLPLLVISLVAAVRKRREVGRLDHLPHVVWAVGVIVLVVVVAINT